MILPLIVLAALNVLLFIFLKNFLWFACAHAQKHCHQAQVQLKRLYGETQKMVAENDHSRESLEKTIEIYEITRNICKSLEQQKVIELFREEAKRHLNVNYCDFLQDEPAPEGGFEVLPLKFEGANIGFLAVKGLDVESREKFEIMSHQFSLGINRAMLYRKVQEIAILDQLTGVFSRRHTLNRLKEEMDYSKKLNLSFAFLMIDIDNFKSFNDSYGHLVGDAILRDVAGLMKSNLREIDLIGRYGGEEFCIIMPHTDSPGAKLAAERIRSAVESRKMRFYDEDLSLTISIGISIFPNKSGAVQDLIDSADKALYKAKDAGRNKVVMS